MRTTITLDDELLAKAHEMTGVAERSTLIHNGLRLLIQREAARRLILLGGSDPTASIPPRRRSRLVADAAATQPAPRKRRAAK
jgi:Arc/MetJ family transcription regulator